MCPVQNSLWQPCSQAWAPRVSPVGPWRWRGQKLTAPQVRGFPWPLAGSCCFLGFPARSLSFLLSRSSASSLGENPQARVLCRVHRHESPHCCVRSHFLFPLCVWIPVSRKLLLKHGSPLILEGFCCNWWIFRGIMLLFGFLCLLQKWVKLESLTFVLECSHFGH